MLNRVPTSENLATVRKHMTEIAGLVNDIKLLTIVTQGKLWHRLRVQMKPTL